MGYAHRLEAKRRIKLADFDPGEDAGLKREEAEQKTARFIEELIELQELLYAVRRRAYWSSCKDAIPAVKMGRSAMWRARWTPRAAR